MLAQVDEGEAQRDRVRPPDRARDGPGLAQQMRGHERCREVEGRHGGEGIASQNIVERAPGGLPEGLAVLDHHAPQRGVVVAQDPGLRGEPRRRGRDHPVADDPEVEDGVHPRGPGREEVRPAQQEERDRRVRHEEPDPVRPDEHLVGAPDRPRPGERALQPQAGQLAEPDRAVDPDRIGHAHPRAQALGIVVGHLVRRDVGPHLQRAHRDVPRARARHGDAQRQRRGGRRRGHQRGRDAGPAAGERNGRADGHHPPRGHADRGRYTHGAASIGPAQDRSGGRRHGDGGRVDAGRRAIS